MHRIPFNCTAFKNALRISLGHHTPASLSSSVDDLHADQEENLPSVTRRIKYNAISNLKTNPSSNINALLFKHCEIHVPQSAKYESIPYWKKVFASALQFYCLPPLSSSILFMRRQQFSVLSISKGDTGESHKPLASSEIQEAKVKSLNFSTKGQAVPISNASVDSAVAIPNSPNSPSASSMSSINSRNSNFTASFTTSSQTESDSSFNTRSVKQASATTSLISSTTSYACHIENKKGCEAAKSDNWCQAIKHWTNAAGLNYPPAQFNLAVFYHSNYQETGNMYDYGLAVKWYDLAVMAGHGEAKKNRSVLSDQLLSQEMSNKKKKLNEKKRTRSNSEISDVKPSLGSLPRWSYPALPINSYSVSSSTRN